MSIPAALSDSEREQRISALIQTLQDAERELQELTGGQLDAVAGKGGKVYLLREAQEQLRQAEASQRQVAKMQQAILDALPAHIALLDKDGVIIAVNEAWRRFARDQSYENADYGVGLNYLSVCSKATEYGAAEAEPAAEGIRRVLRGETPLFELEYPCEDAPNAGWFRLTASPVAGEVLPRGAVLTHQDITEHKKAELDRQNLVRDLGERVKELRTLYEVTRLLTEEEAPLAEVLRRLADALRGALRFPAWAMVRVTYGQIEGGTGNFNDNGSPWRLEMKFVLRNGEAARVQVIYGQKPPRSGDPIFLEEERCLIETVGGQLRSHLERRLAVEALRHSEASMAEAQRIAHVGSWELTLSNLDDIDANPLSWSEEAFRIAGYEPYSVEVSNKLFFSLVPPEEHALVRDAAYQAVRDHTDYDVVHRLVRPDGSTRVVHERARLFFDAESGALQRMVGTVHDITEQRELVRQLEAERARLVSAQRVGKVGSWEVDVVTMSISWSAETYRILEADPRLFILTPSNLEELVHPADRDVVRQAFLEAPKQKEASTLEHRLLLPGGQVKYVEQRWQMFFDDSGRPVRAIGTCQDITERRQVSEEMEQTAALLRAVVDGTTDAVFVKDLEGRYQFFNDGGARMVGCSVTEALGRDDRALFPPEDAELVMKNDRQAIASGQALMTEEVVTTKDGSLRTFLSSKAPYCDTSGKVIGVIGIARDISKRKKQEHLLAVLSTLGRDLNAATTPRRAAEIIVVAADDLFGWDAATLDLYDAKEDRITSVLNIDSIDGTRMDCQPTYDQASPSALARGVITTGPRLILRHEEGTPLNEDESQGCRFGDVERPSLSMMFVPIGTRQVMGVLSIHSYRAQAYTAEDLKVMELLADYCDGALNRIQTESLRQVSEERFREMAENIGDIFYSYDPEHNRLLYANRAFEEIWGRSLKDLHENPLIYLKDVHQEDLPTLEAALQSQLEGSKAEIEFRALRSDGQLRWVRQQAVPILDSSGCVNRIVGTMRDITESRITADRVAEQAALLDKAHDAILVRDLDDRVLFWNKSAEKMYGWTSIEASGRSISRLLYQDEARFEEATKATLTYGEWTGELVKLTRTGRPITVLAHWSLVRDDKGQPRSILCIETDVTERKIMEAQYLRAQRMESIGTLAGGIAHDLNNVLTPILMSIELLRLQEQQPRKLEVLATIEESARRGADMVRQVLSFARGIEGRQIELAPQELFAEVARIINETFPKNIHLRLSVPADLWRIQGDPTQLHQVLLNLCLNARDAMPEGGVLHLEAANVVLDEQYAGMSLDARPGPCLRIQVEDTGMGMTAEVLERIFEPFYTTKELGKGTGLGLSSSLAIVKSHSGFMRVSSDLGKGTRFQVYFPAQPDAVGTTVASSTPELPRGRGELILVIDDEASVRHVTAQTLETFGYQVLLAADGAEATAIYASRQQEIAVVLTDMMMPLMDGPATIQVLMRVNPQVRIIAASGVNTTSLTTKAANAGANHFIPKPYTAETLLTTLRLVLDEVQA